jgi:hypothetical protein
VLVELGETPTLSWALVYTKAQAEAWVDANLRNQGFATLLPRVASRGGFKPLFPRYVFAGFEGPLPRQIQNTFGVQYLVRTGERPTRVPPEVIAELRARMNANGVVLLDQQPAADPLFAKRERDRLRALIKLTEAGFRVRIA